MMKILITGPRGNLGAHIIKHCTHDVVCLDRSDWSNLTSILSSGIDIVVHSAYDLKRSVKKSPIELVNSNILATTRLIETMHQCNVPRMVYLSSCSVYGDSMTTREEQGYSPLSVDGYFKTLNEKIISSYSLENNIDFSIYRIFNLYGGNDGFSVLHHLKKSIETGLVFNLNNHGVSQRDFIHVEDVAKIILQLLEVENPHQYLNIGTGVPTRIADIVNIAIRKYPSLKIKNVSFPEAEYSRANIERLTSLVKYDFMRVIDYVEEYI